MISILSRPLTYLLLLAFILLGGWISFLPVRVASNLELQVEEKFGRDLAVGTASYRFSPEFGIAIQNVSLAGSAVHREPLIQAKTIVLPTSIWQLLIGGSPLHNLILEDADIRVAFDGVGHNNVGIDQSPKSNSPFHLTLRNTRFHYFDERSGDRFGIENVSAILDLLDDGEMKSSGSGTVKGQFITFDTTLASLERVFSDGSPFELSVEGVASLFSFSGRITTAKRLNLSGQAHVESSDVPRLFKWLGSEIAKLISITKLSADGAVEMDGPVVFLKNTALKLDGMTAQGDISFSNVGTRANMTAALGFDFFDLNSLLPKFAPSENWSEVAMDFSGLNEIDAQFRISANSIHFHDLKTASAKIEGALKDRVLSAVFNSDFAEGGSGQFDIKFDAVQLPPRLTVESKLSAVAAKPVLAALFDQTFFSGVLTMDASLSAIGNTASAFISSLAGTANASLVDAEISGHDLTAPFISTTKGWNGGTSKNLKAMVQASFAEGVATLGENLVEGTNGPIRFSGEIDVLRKSLDLVALSNAKLNIKGPWAKPVIDVQ